MLDNRKQKILKAVVHNFITNGVPIGSKSLAESLNLGISPATIRNELSKLEGMGYLYQPHVSAGRVPTDLGYRYYVDSLSGRTRLREEEKRAILTLFSNKTRELENLLQETSTLLSRLTSTAALVIAPRLRRNTIKHLDLVELSEEFVLMVIITDTGRVEKKPIRLEGKVNAGDIEEAQAFLNMRLQGKGLDELEDAVEESELGAFKAAGLATKAIFAIGDILSQEKYEKVFVGGTVNLLRYLEEDGMARIENLLDHFEEQYFLLNMLKEVLRSNELVVRIGYENLYEDLQAFSLVATPYAIGDETVGTISVVGPTRMDYARVIPTVDFIAKTLSRTLDMLKG
ncbi:MAG: heat-inducible transcriptional repressor HrcA [Actinomycetota bacterium]|nr:heat-inducible transcriptional repressor HrcA [Actinomycetota bacterium]